MKRRNFIKGATFGAFAVSTTGLIRFNGTSYIGDCQTTTDILGPFYRPNAPVRNDLVIENLPGEIVTLTGKILHDDCTTPLDQARVELWHCSADEVYDNDSDEYRYRGTTFSDTGGDYHFRTQMPVPYDAGGGNYRPAHFHLMISAPGYQNLITQLYFAGDPYLDKDLSSRSPSAQSRILKTNRDGQGNLVIPFNIIMQKKLPADPVALDRLVGRYAGEGDHSQNFEFFKHEDQLWLRNDLFGISLQYLDNNTFKVPGIDSRGSWQIRFDLQGGGKVQAVSTRTDSKGKKTVTQARKM
jgi:catechol 1,2-dioxygenase